MLNNKKKIKNLTFNKTSSIRPKIKTTKQRKKTKIPTKFKKTKILNKKFIYNPEFKLTKAERTEKEFEKVNVILKLQNNEFFNNTFKIRALNTNNKLVNLEKEKKKKLLETKINIPLLCLALFSKIQKNKRYFAFWRI